ncbi:MAG: GNAT family N-acetyltransferase [Erysipelotrichaceae bacterium]|nr:GNAT family N-acetyltransferase [Erysipelotrichaceae bacterium]
MNKPSDYNIAEMSMLLSRAFAKDPWTRKLFTDDSKKSQAFFTMIIRYCEITGGQVLIDHQGSTLASVACLERPMKLSLFDVLKLLGPFITFIFACGFSSFNMLNTYMRLTSRHRPKEKHYYLTCLGVSPEFMGKKIGKKMLDTIHRIVDEDTTSTGIGLDTENLDNITMYEHFGYRLIATENLSGMNIYIMFRPRKTIDRN